MQNWSAPGGISWKSSKGYQLYVDNSIEISRINLRSIFGSSTHDYTFNLTPAFANNSGYVRISRNTGNISAFEFIVPFLSKIYLDSSVLTNYSTLSSFLCRIRSTSQSGSVGVLNCLYVTENGKIYTEKTSERYYNLTTPELPIGS